MGHRDIATTRRYTHLRPIHEIPAHERPAAAMPIADLVMDPRRRARNKPVGKSVGTRTDTDRQTPTKTGSLRHCGRRASPVGKSVGTFSGSDLHLRGSRRVEIAENPQGFQRRLGGDRLMRYI